MDTVEIIAGNPTGLASTIGGIVLLFLYAFPLFPRGARAARRCAENSIRWFLFWAIFFSPVAVLWIFIEAFFEVDEESE